MKTKAVCAALLALVGLTAAVRADFLIRQSPQQDWLPSVAYNADDHEYLVVWSEGMSYVGGSWINGVKAQRIGDDGSILGSPFVIFQYGVNPVVAYNATAREYLVGFNPGGGFVGQRVSRTGASIGDPTTLMNGVSDGRLLYNSITGQYLFVGAKLAENPVGSGYYDIQVSTCNISATGQQLTSPAVIVNRAHGYNPPEPAFGVAYAPVQSSETPYGRYLLAIGRGMVVYMLNSAGAIIDIVSDPDHPGTFQKELPFRAGPVTAGEFGVDVAYGEESGYGLTGPAFLVVWADQNNTSNGRSWNGVWGGFVNATTISYLTTDVIDDAFPISGQADHYAQSQYIETWKPKVCYNPSSKKFFVVWRETPNNNPLNSVFVNHIRGSYVFERIPANNVVISDITGTEDPQRPAVAASTTSEYSLVAWQDSRNLGSVNLDVYGSVQKVAEAVHPPPPPPAYPTVVTNTLDSGPGSLRQAILNANAHSGKDTITFDISGAGLHTIVPSTELPVITDPVIIDGYTQQGSSANTNALKDGDNAVHTIEIDGSAVTAAMQGGFGLQVHGGNSCIRGLVIRSFGNYAAMGGAAIELAVNGGDVVEGNCIQTDHVGLVEDGNGNGIRIVDVPNNVVGGSTPAARNVICARENGVFIGHEEATGNSVIGNYIGVNATGNGVLGSPFAGIYISQAPANTVGGAASGVGNVIGGCGERGQKMFSQGYCIIVQGDTAHGNVIAGNLLGTNADGSDTLTNSQGGILIGGSGNTIGGTDAGARNVIAGNHFAAIDVTAGDNVFQGNYIGVDGTGTKALPNGLGITIRFGNNNVVGGEAPGAGNVIAYSDGDGVSIANSSTGNRISGNSIYANGGLGINLRGGSEDLSGVTPNDVGDADTGPNNLQNFPLIGTLIGGGHLSVSGLLNSTADRTFTVEFFATPTVFPLRYGEGKTFLGSIQVVTDASGDAPFDLTIGAPMAAGQTITATATDAEGNTSEFGVPAALTLVEGAEVVTNTLDSGPGSFRQAILNSNAKDVRDTIIFSIPGTGVHTITPGTPLPVITGAVVIDGFTQPGSSVNTNGLEGPCNAVLTVVLDGSNAVDAESPPNGLVVSAGNSAVRGLVINSFAGNGITLRGKSGNSIEGNYIGTDNEGSASKPNRIGLEIDSSGSNYIGGTSTDSRNVIAGNLLAGILIDSPNSASNLVRGNYVGVRASGTAPLSTGGYGISILAGVSTMIGGSAPGAGNVISGAGQYSASSYAEGQGIFLGRNVEKTTVMGNIIGLNARGDDMLANAQVGIWVGGKGNFIGGISASARNVISGCKFSGIAIYGDSNFVRGNYIGTDIGGTTALGNGSDGVAIVGAKKNVVGGRTAGAANVISGNGGSGVYILGGGSGYDASHNRLEGNRIGTKADGATPLGNAGSGVLIKGQSARNAIGDSAGGAGNIIAFNGLDGVQLGDTTTLSNVPPDPAWNPILRNSIFGNGRLGINLVRRDDGIPGITYNDPGDTDLGPNYLQNYPLLSEVVGGSAILVHGSLSSVPNNRFRIELFATSAAYGAAGCQGQTYLGATSVQTDGVGDSWFSATFDVPVAAGRMITATATDTSGNTSEFSAPITVVVTDVQCTAGVPGRHVLLQNYPNPFNPTTYIRYGVQTGGHVEIAVFNVLGQQVSMLVDAEQCAGYHEIQFDGKDLASGVYFYRMRSGSFVETKRLLLMR
jgi:hypothetical protein